MKYVMIGAGAAGITAAREIREQDKTGEITMLSLDEVVHSRCMLHKYISGERDEKGIDFIEEDFFETNRIQWEKGVFVTGIKTTEKRVVLADDREVPYDKLLIATGANSFIPPVGDFRHANNVFGLRHLQDAKAIREMAQNVENVLIVGSGLVGLDVAYGLLEMGKKITVVEMADRILPIQLDEHAAKEYQTLFEKAGCKFILGKQAAEAKMDSERMIHEVGLSSGEKIACDIIIVAAGVRPSVEFLQDGEIKMDRSILVDDCLCTNVPDIYAAGDVAGLSGIWPNAMKQGKTAARNMCGSKERYEDTYAFKNTINFFGLVSLCIGQIQIQEGDIVEVQEDQRIYRRAVMQDNKLKSMLLQGDISHAGIWQYLIKNKVDLSDLNKPVFQLTFADFFGMGERGKYVWNV